jgi:hypothetical protein
LPSSFNHLGVEGYVFLAIVLDGEMFEVLPNLGARGVVLRPFGIRFKGNLIGMGWSIGSDSEMYVSSIKSWIRNLHVTSNTRVGVLQPGSTYIVVLLVTYEFNVLEFARDADTAHETCEAGTNVDDP